MVLLSTRNLPIVEDNSLIMKITLINQLLHFRVIADGQFLDQPCREWTRYISLEDTIDIDSRSMNTFRINFAILYDFLHLSDNKFGRSCHVGIEVTLGLLELKVAHFISSFGFNQGEVRKDGLFPKIFAAIEDKSGLTRRDNLSHLFPFFIDD
jgi:hypothetical protein